MCRRLLFLLSFFLLSLTASTFAQDQFSADMYDSKNGGPPTLEGKFYMTANKVRIDTAQTQSHGIVILDMATQKNILLMPERKMYMEMPQSPAFQRQAYNFFRPSDVNNACVDWEQLPAARGANCRKLGSEVVNGRNTVKYEGSKNGETSYIWLDPSLRFPVKWQGKTAWGELQNINVSPQPTSLFEVPAGYQKMQMPAGMPPAQQHP